MAVRKWEMFVGFLAFSCLVYSKKSDEDKPAWAKKDIRDYTDADMERLLDQWDEDEEPLPEDELPEHLRPQPKFNFDPSNLGDPEDLLKMSKKGRTLMMFVQVKDEKSPEEAEDVTKLWQSALYNSHIQAERYMVDERRAIFMFKDGAQAWDAKDFLLEQPELRECSIENKVYHGYHTPEGKKEKAESAGKKPKPKKGKKKKDEL
ncbi:Chaperone for wingless signaling and trafficking of LDL receptor [Halocaridina rubra]|uniref:Chaperone for wingless signaling and trafficking of LDL receptor n=1 Tax=Halocaridina rubra TaxID=373956 RepID=A0AAN8WWE3_HALRR